MATLDVGPSKDQGPTPRLVHIQQSQTPLERDGHGREIIPGHHCTPTYEELYPMAKYFTTGVRGQDELEW